MVFQRFPSGLDFLVAASESSRIAAAASRIRWRFWSWLPEYCSAQDTTGSSGSTGSHHHTHLDTLATQMVHFKQALHPSDHHLYTTAELRRYATQRQQCYSPILDFVADAECPELPMFDSNLSQHSTNTTNRCYFIFKDGVRPLWEDEYNAAGGCWTVRLSSATAGVHDPRVLWQIMILLLADDRMQPYLVDEVCGLGLSIRTNHATRRSLYKLSVWTRDASSAIVNMAIGHLLKSMLPYRTSGKLQYKAHSHTVQQNLAKLCVSPLSSPPKDFVMIPTPVVEEGIAHPESSPRILGSDSPSSSSQDSSSPSSPKRGHKRRRRHRGRRAQNNRARQSESQVQGSALSQQPITTTLISC